MINIKSLGIKIIAPAILGFSLIGCTMATPIATSGSYEGLKNTDPEKGTIFVYRDNSFAGAANQYDVMVNDVLVGSLSNGSFFSINASPGETTVNPKTLTSAGLGKGSKITVERGKSYCLKLDLNFCFSCKSADINIVNTEQCDKEMKSLDKVQLKK